MDTFIPDFDDDEAEPEWTGFDAEPVELSWEAKARMLVRITRSLLAWQLANCTQSQMARWN